MKHTAVVLNQYRSAMPQCKTRQQKTAYVVLCWQQNLVCVAGACTVNADSLYACCCCCCFHCCLVMLCCPRLSDVELCDNLMLLLFAGESAPDTSMHRLPCCNSSVITSLSSTSLDSRRQNVRRRFTGIQERPHNPTTPTICRSRTAW